MTARQSLHTGSAAHAVLAAQDARLDLAGLLALNGPTPLDVRQGILYAPGSPLNVTGDSSTSPWRYTVAAGSAVMSKGNADGPHLMTNDGTVLVSTTVPPGSNSRYDLIYIVQQDIDATISPDGSTAAVIGVVNGTPGASPAVPALPAGAIALATALVASTAATGTSGAGVTISTLVSRYTTTRGNPIPVRNTTERAEITAYELAQVYRLDLHAIETHNGTAWTNPLEVIGCKTAKNATQIITGGAGLTAVTFPATEWDSTAFHSNVTNNSRITIPAGLGGKYLIIGKIGTSLGNAGATLLSIWTNGVVNHIIAAASLVVGQSLQGSTTVQLNAGDYIELAVQTAVTATLQTNLADYTPCYFSAVLLGV